jgi:hypothetical protein
MNCPSVRPSAPPEAVQGVTALRHIAQHLLTLFPHVVWQQSANLAECDPSAAPETRIVRSYAGGLHAQGEAGEAAVVNLKRLFRGLCQLARQELRSNKGSHVNLLPVDAISLTIVCTALISAGGAQDFRTREHGGNAVVSLGTSWHRQRHQRLAVQHQPNASRALRRAPGYEPDSRRSIVAPNRSRLQRNAMLATSSARKFRGFHVIR